MGLAIQIDMTRRKKSWAFQLVARCCLIALLGTWAPHVHEAPESAGGEPGQFDSAEFALSSDDAHEEHSSMRETAHVVCAFCRGEERCEDAQLATVYPGSDQTSRNPAYDDPIARRTHTLFARLPLTRAPPSAPSV